MQADRRKTWWVEGGGELVEICHIEDSVTGNVWTVCIQYKYFRRLTCGEGLITCNIFVA